MPPKRFVIGAGGALAEVTLAEAPDDAVERFARVGYGLLLLTDLFVHPQLRGKGWGRDVCEMALQHADAEGYDLYLYCASHGKGRRPSNLELQLFYHTLGFELVPKAKRTVQQTEMVRLCQRMSPT